MIYTFDGLILNLPRFELSRSGEPIGLEPQVFDVLAYLVENHDRVVTKEELLDKVWGDRFVSEAALNSRVMAARKAIGDSGREQRLIKTVHGRGYRFAGPVGTSSDAGTLPPTPPAPAIERTAPSHAPGHPLARDEECDRLKALVARADAGDQQAVFLVGESGIGKTTILEAFMAEAETAGALIARGQCLHHRGESEAYMPVFEALAGLCRGPDKDLTIGLLVRHAPTWVVQMPWLLDADEYEALQRRVVGATRERMLREVGEALGALSASRTLVIALEDLQWVDHSSVDFISHLARTRTKRRLMLVGTYRSADAQTAGHPVHALAQELALRGEAEQLLLGPLPPTAVDAYLRSRFPGNEPEGGVAELLWEMTSGNPLYVTAIVNHWTAAGSLAASGGMIRATPSLETLSRGIPPTLQQLVEQRFAQLEEGSQRLLEAASVAGRQFTAAESAAAAGVPLEGADTLLSGLARHGQFLESAGDEEWRDGTTSGRYRFLHEFYQEALYQRLPAARRSQFHRAIGDRLETAFGSSAAEIASQLAVHFRNGRDDERARRYLHLSADVAMRRAGHDEALSQLRSALDLLERAPESRERRHEEAVLLIKLATCLAATRGWADPGVETSSRRAYELATDIADPVLLSRATYALGSFHEIRGNYERSHELINQHLELQPDPEAETRVDSHELLACSEFHQGLFESSLSHADRGVGLYRTQHHNPLAAYGDNPGVACHDWAALSLWFLGYPDEALARAREAMTLAEDPYNFYSLANARVQFAIVHQLRREPAPCEQWADATVSLSTRYGYAYRTGMGMIVGGWARAAQGRTDEGIGSIMEGLDVAMGTGAEMDHAYFLGLLAEAHLFAGNPEQTEAMVQEALARIPQGRTFFYEAELHRLRGRAALDSSGDVALASRAFRRAFEVAQAQKARSLQLRAGMALVTLSAESNEIERALAELASVYTHFKDGLQTPDLLEASAMLNTHSRTG